MMTTGSDSRFLLSDTWSSKRLPRKLISPGLHRNARHEENLPTRGTELHRDVTSTAVITCCFLLAYYMQES